MDIIATLDAKMRKENKKIVLLMDNYSGHGTAADYERFANVKPLFFMPNVTGHLQIQMQIYIIEIAKSPLIDKDICILNSNIFMFLPVS